ncbi:MAG: acetyl-CoA C-acyltransferase [Betaproteobacteria bacterium]|nr:acetyl-CoA C-acyltransferase [Betaproteobacteria bacterium]
MNPVYLVPGLRTPFCKVDGPLAQLDAIQMSIPVAQAMTNIAKPDVMVWGTVIPSLRWSNLAREVLLDAKLDPAIPAISTVQACATSMVGVFEAAGMLTQDRSLALVGGVEAMSQVQIGLTQGFSNWLRALMQARSLGQRIDVLTGVKFKHLRLDIPSVKNRVTGRSMGEHCEEMAKHWKIPREAQDRIAFESHQRAVKAMAGGFFDDLIHAVNGTAKDGIPRADSTPEKLATLRPAFDRQNGTITAGNASPLTDGAAAIWVANEEGLKRLPPNAPRVKLLDYEMSGVDIFNEGLLMAPAYAIPRLLARNALTLASIDLWEIHEAFAAQVLCNIAAIENEAFVREKAGVSTALGKFPWDRLNPNGGSVAIGHPFGATGARILSQAAKELHAIGPGKRAIVSICADGGLGAVALLETD